MKSESGLIHSLNENQQKNSLLQIHHLEGLLYHYYQPIFCNQTLQTRYKKQWIHNHVLLEELNLLSIPMQESGITAVMLKGAHLLHDLYLDIGSRFMSDIDLLIAVQDLDKFHNLLLNCGYKKNESTKFYGNHFKSDWSKSIGDVEINIELHTQLFYHTKYEVWNLVPSSITNFQKLSHEDCFIHLCGHLAFQHGFQKLQWLFDIHFFLEKYGDQMDWKLISQKCKNLKLYRSLMMCLWANNQYFSNEKDYLSIKKEWWQHFLTKNFLLNPEKNKLNYFLIKHATKDHLLEAFYYDLTWFWHYKVLRNMKLKIAP